MVSIQSTTRPYGIDNNTGSSISSSINNTGNVGNSGIATESLKDTDDSSINVKQSTITPPVNNFNQGIRQQAIDTKTGEVKYENRFVSNKPKATNQNLSTQDRSNLNILNKWTSRIKASNASGQVTTYSDDPSTVPLLRRDTSMFFNVDYNTDGSYHVVTNGFTIPGTDIKVGYYDMGNMSWNPIKAYSVAEPVGTYLLNFSNYDTKNKIIQGTMALSHSYNNYYDGTNNLVDDYAIREWGNLVDMSVNWKDRNTLQNAMAGLNTVTGLSQRYGFNDYLGGNATVGGIQDGIALYTFGNSVYNLGKNWGKMSNAERVGATISTMNAGVQAYQGLESLYGLYTSMMSSSTTTAASTAAGTAAGAGAGAASAGAAGAGAGAAAGAGASVGAAGAGASVGAAGAGAASASAGAAAGAGAAEGASAGTAAAASGSTGASVATAAAGVLGFAAAAYGTYNYCSGMGKMTGHSTGEMLATGGLIAGFGSSHATAKDRQAGAMMGASEGAAVGAFIGTCICPGIGTAIGAAIGVVAGAAKGLIQTSGIGGGHSREQWKRGLYRQTMAQVGIYDKKGKGDPNHGHYFYQLADGQEYNVGIDGSGNHCLDINGNTKKVYDTSMIKEGDKFRTGKDGSTEMLPYNIDYTCNMDFSGSLMLAPLNALGLGGSNTKGAGEYDQTLGYMVNAVTSNVARDMTRENWNKMIDNIKAGYERVGIKDKQTALDTMSYMYSQGNLTDDDWQSFQLALNLLYDKNGYDQAMSLMEQLGRPDQREAMEVNTDSKEESVQKTTEESKELPAKNPKEETVTEYTSKSATLSQKGATDTTPQKMTESDATEVKGNEQTTNPGEE